MRRGELYRVLDPGGRDPKKSRAFVVVSRQAVIDSRFPTVICAPVHSSSLGLETQIRVGTDAGLKHDSAILCDGLVSMPKSRLTDYIGSLSPPKVQELRTALLTALELS